MSVYNRLRSFLDIYYNRAKVDHPNHLNEAVDLYNEFYVHNNKEYNLKKQPVAKAGCASCNNRILNGLKNLIDHNLLNNLTTKEQHTQRLEACSSCDKYWKVTNQCGVCKCFVYLKSKLKTEDCPHPKGSKWD